MTVLNSQPLMEELLRQTLKAAAHKGELYRLKPGRCWFLMLERRSDTLFDRFLRDCSEEEVLAIHPQYDRDALRQLLRAARQNPVAFVIIEGRGERAGLLSLEDSDLGYLH